MPIIPTVPQQQRLDERKVFNPPGNTSDAFNAELAKQSARSGRLLATMINATSNLVDSNRRASDIKAKEESDKAVAVRQTALSADWDQIQSFHGDDAENSATFAAERARMWKDDPKSPYAKLSPKAREYFDKEDLDLHTRQISNAATFAMRSKQVNRQVAAEASADAANLYLQNSPDPRDATLMDKAATAHALALSKGRVTMVPDADGNVTPTYASEADSQAFETATQTYKTNHRVKLAASTLDRLNAADPEDIKTVTFLRSQYEQDIKDMPETVRAQLNEAYSRAGQSMEYRRNAKQQDAINQQRVAEQAESTRLTELKRGWYDAKFQNTEQYLKQLYASPYAKVAMPMIEDVVAFQAKQQEDQAAKTEESAKEKAKETKAFKNRAYDASLTIALTADKKGNTRIQTSAEMQEDAVRLYVRGDITQTQRDAKIDMAKQMDNKLARRFHEDTVSRILPTFASAIELTGGEFSLKDTPRSDGSPKYPFDKATTLRDNDTTKQRKYILLGEVVTYMNAIRERLANDKDYTLQQAKIDFEDATLEKTEEAKKLSILDHIRETYKAAKLAEMEWKTRALNEGNSK
jgi:hypothetical protein